MCYQIKKANKGYKPKDPLKRPAILYLTQENKENETIDRLFSLSADDTSDVMKNYTPTEAIKTFRKKGLKLTKEDNIDIIVMYREPRSIDTSDLYTIIDELEEQGIEVICLVQDYIKKMKSAEYEKDLRLELGKITDEFKALAIAKDIPVITASQLNKESVKSIEMAIESNKTDSTRVLNISGVGESFQMMENSDCVIIINREMSLSENQRYLTFKRVKIRYGSQDSIDYFNHPFRANEFGLMEDTDFEEPLSKKYLSDRLVGIDNENRQVMDNKNGRMNYMKRPKLGEDEVPGVKDEQKIMMINQIFGGSSANL